MKHYKLIFLALDIGDVHVMGGGAKIFELLASEDVDSNKMDLGMAVFAGLGRAHFDDLARAAFDDNEPVLAEGRTLLWIGSGSTGIGALEGVLVLLGQLVSIEWKEVAARAHAPAWRGKSSRESGSDLPGHRRP